GRKRSRAGYRPTTIKTPAAIARIAITVPSPEKLRLNSGISPVRTSQAASNSIPRFRITLIGRLPCTPAGEATEKTQLLETPHFPFSQIILESRLSFGIHAAALRRIASRRSDDRLRMYAESALNQIPW